MLNYWSIPLYIRSIIGVSVSTITAAGLVFLDTFTDPGSSETAFFLGGTVGNTLTVALPRATLRSRSSC